MDGLAEGVCEASAVPETDGLAEELCEIEKLLEIVG